MAGNDNTVKTRRPILGGPVFQFNKDHLQYFGIKEDFKVKYEEIVAPAQYLRHRSSARMMRLVPIYIGLLVLVLSNRNRGQFRAVGFDQANGEAVIFLAAIAAILIALRFLTRKDYTIVGCASGQKMLVRRDKKHDQTLERIQAERLRSLRQFSAPDPANSPDEELAKLRWLRDEGAISESEYAVLCAQGAA